MIPMTTWIWAVVVIIFLLLEVSLPGILQIWFAIGALIAGIVSWFCPDEYIAQLVTFIITSGILTIIFSRVFSDKNGTHPAGQSPVYSILGKTAVVTKEIDTAHGLGKISVGGEVWSAKAKNDEVIPENTKVKVLDIDGVKAVVEVIKE